MNKFDSFAIKHNIFQIKMCLIRTFSSVRGKFCFGKWRHNFNAKKRLRHLLVQGIAIFIYMVAKILFPWSYTVVNGATKAIVERTHIFT